MSTDRDVTRIVRSWLDDGATRLPDRVLDRVLDALPATPQRRAWWPAWRFREMNAYLKVATAAVAILVVAVTGFALLPRSGGVGGPAPTASPGPSTTPASATPSASSVQALPDGPVPAGTYLVERPFRQPFTVGVCPAAAPPASPSPCGNLAVEDSKDDAISWTVSVPDGWEGFAGSTGFDRGLWIDGNGAPGGAALGVGRGLSALYDDPCRTDLAIPTIPVGPGVDDFVDALANHPLLEVTEPVDIGLSGYAGKSVTLQVPADIARCSENYRPGQPGIYAQDPGHRWTLRILDVDGVRVVVQSMDYETTPPAIQAELQAMVDSIVITP